MKKYLSLFMLLFVFCAAKAQVHTPYMNDISNVVFDSRNQDPIYGGIPGVPMDNPSPGEYTYTDATGTTVDFSWYISGSTIYWNVDVEAPSSDILQLHRLWIVDDGTLTNDPETIVDDDYEGSAWGSSSWTSSGSASLGSGERSLFFSFENVDADPVYYNDIWDYEHFTGTIHYNQPL